MTNQKKIEIPMQFLGPARKGMKDYGCRPMDSIHRESKKSDTPGSSCGR